jgi:uncharacterized membrane-anchored protein YitT (DUF2179 family)
MFKQQLVSYGTVLLGALIYSIGLNAFLVTNHLAEGGFVGISILLFYKLNFPFWLTFLILNIPLLFPSWKLFGHEFIIKTTLGVVAVSLFSLLTERLQLPTGDPLLAALYAGFVTGLGLGLIFRAGATTGGADIIARLARHFYGVGMGRTLFSIDVIVIGLVAVIIGLKTAMYSLVALFVASRVIDFVIEGVSRGKALMIISDKNQEISDKINAELERGTTLLQARGGFTGYERQVVYCVVGREEVRKVKNIVQKTDPAAFVVVNEIHEVLGEGFTYHPPQESR